MSSISNRVTKLEAELGSGGRIIIASLPREMTDEQLETHLEAYGISTRIDDLVISLQRLADGEQAAWVSVDGQRIADPDAAQS